MRRMRFSLSWIIFAVALVAGDFAFLGLLGSEDDLSIIRLISVLLMGNVLALGLFRYFARRDRPQPYLIGFEVAGSAAAILISLVPRYDSEIILVIQELLRRYWPRLAGAGPFSVLDILFRSTFLTLIPVAVHSVPFLIAAPLGGWLLLRYHDPRRIEDGLPPTSPAWTTAGSPARADQNA